MADGVYLSEEELRAAVQAELDDPAYEGRDHHDLKTYNMGCKGPLCRKKMRDYGRHLYRARNGVPDQDRHRPTVRTQWDALLDTLPRRQVVAT